MVWLDAIERKYVEEMGGMNLFFVFGSGPDARLVTPSLSGSLLPGITRDSLLALAADAGFAVEERKISTDEWREKAASGEITEVFACGTAAVITPVGRVKSAEGEFTIADGEPGKITMALRDTLTGIQRGTFADTHGWMTSCAESAHRFVSGPSASGGGPERVRAQGPIRNPTAVAATVNSIAAPSTSPLTPAKRRTQCRTSSIAPVRATTITSGPCHHGGTAHSAATAAAAPHTAAVHAGCESATNARRNRSARRGPPRRQAKTADTRPVATATATASRRRPRLRADASACTPMGRWTRPA